MPLCQLLGFIQEVRCYLLIRTPLGQAKKVLESDMIPYQDCQLYLYSSSLIFKKNSDLCSFTGSGYAGTGGIPNLGKCLRRGPLSTRDGLSMMFMARRCCSWAETVLMSGLQSQLGHLPRISAIRILAPARVKQSGDQHPLIFVQFSISLQRRHQFVG